MHWAFPITQSLNQLGKINIKKRMLFKNMVYVGFLCEWLKVEEQVIKKSVEDMFSTVKGDEIVRQNLQALDIGKGFAFKRPFPFALPEKIFEI